MKKRSAKNTVQSIKVLEVKRREEKLEEEKKAPIQAYNAYNILFTFVPDR